MANENLPAKGNIFNRIINSVIDSVRRARYSRMNTYQIVKSINKVINRREPQRIISALSAISESDLREVFLSTDFLKAVYDYAITYPDNMSYILDNLPSNVASKLAMGICKKYYFSDFIESTESIALDVYEKSIEKIDFENETSEDLKDLIVKEKTTWRRFNGAFDKTRLYEYNKFPEYVFEKISPEKRNELFDKLIKLENIDYTFIEIVPELLEMLDPKDRLKNYNETIKSIENYILNDGMSIRRGAYYNIIIRSRNCLSKSEKEKTLLDTLQLLRKIPKELEWDLSYIGNIFGELTPNDQIREFAFYLDLFGVQTPESIKALNNIINNCDKSIALERYERLLVQIDRDAPSDKYNFSLCKDAISGMKELFATMSFDEKKDNIGYVIRLINDHAKDGIRDELLSFYKETLDENEKEVFFSNFLNAVLVKDGYQDESEHVEYIKGLAENGKIISQHFPEIINATPTYDKYEVWCYLVEKLDEHQIEEKNQDIIGFIQSFNNDAKMGAYSLLYRKLSGKEKKERVTDFIDLIASLGNNEENANVSSNIQSVINDYIAELKNQEDKSIDKKVQELFEYVNNSTTIGECNKSPIFIKLFSHLSDEEKVKKFEEYFNVIYRLRESLENETDKRMVSNLFNELPLEAKPMILIDFFLADKDKDSYSAEIIKTLSISSILRDYDGYTIPEEIIERFLKEDHSLSLRLLCFDKDIDKDKLKDLSRYDKMKKGDSINIDSVLTRIYSDKTLSKEEINQKIADVYTLLTYGNMPDFIKTFRLFQLSSDRIYSAENDRFESLAGKSEKERDLLILQGLFVSSLCSNNQSLRRFLNILQNGKRISAKLQGNPEKNFQNLSENEVALLMQYRDTLFELYNITNDINGSKKHLDTSDDIPGDLNRIVSAYAKDNKSNNYVFNVNKVFNELLGNISEAPLTPKNMLEFMDEIQKESIERFHKISKQLREGTIKLEEGDWVKGIQEFEAFFPRFLKSTLNAGEFYQEYSHSDCTPLDCDFGYISKDNLGSEDDYKVLLSTISGTYGRTWIVLKKYDERIKKLGSIVVGDAGQLKYSPEFVSITQTGTHQDRYALISVPATDIDYIVTTEWKDKYGYMMAMAGRPIPVKNQDGVVVFSNKEYEAIRKMMAGLSYYGMEHYEVDSKAMDMQPIYELYRQISSKDSETIEKEIDDIEMLISKGQIDDETQKKREEVISLISSFFKLKGIKVANNLSSNLSSDSVELIDTGSTGRGTNLPGDGDFDFTIRHNLTDEEINEFHEYLKTKVPLSKDGKVEIIGQGFRIKGAILPSGECVDIDCVSAKKDLELEYSSDLCVRDRLESIRKQHPESYNYVIANIIMAKKILKELKLYKKRGSDGASEYGGFGGIGVENWILQNGGSFAQAINTYLEAAEKAPTYDDFISLYPIFDFGSNHRGDNVYIHDRYSAFLGKKENDSEYGLKYAKARFSEIKEMIQSLSKLKHDNVKSSSPLAASVNCETMESLARQFTFVDYMKLISYYESRERDKEDVDEGDVHKSDVDEDGHSNPE